MTHFIDKTGYTLNIRMVDNNTGIDFENDFFEVGGLKQDEHGNYIVDDIDYLVDQAKDCWACRGDYSDGGEAATFYLFYTIEDMCGTIYKLLNTVHIDAMNLLDGGWTPEDYDEIREEYDLTEDEVSEICEEMERILNVSDGSDIDDMRYREAREAGELDYIFG